MVADSIHTPTFADPALDAQVLEQGYAVAPFLSAEEAARVVAAYDALRPVDDRGLVIDFLRSDRTLMGEVAALLQPFWEERLGSLFADHRVAVATFVTKHPGPDSAMLLHEEPSFVDERRARSHALWIPLVDVSPELDNGHLLLLPGSSGLARGLAGFNTPVQHRPYEADIWPRLVSISAKAGDAVVYDSRTLHASVPNRSDRPRPAIAASVVPAGESLVHVVATGRRGRRIHAVPDDFYLRCRPGDFDPLALDEPVIAEVVETQPLDPRSLADLLQVQDLDGPRPAVPPAIAHRFSVVDGASLPLVRGASEPASADLRLEQDALEPDPQGPLRAIEADRAWLGRRVADAPWWRPHAGSSVVVVEPGGVIVVRTADPERSCWLEILDAPMVNAGAATAGAAAAVDAGDRLEVRCGVDHALWNDGPGQLIAAVDQSRPAGFGRGLLSALRSRG